MPAKTQRPSQKPKRGPLHRTTENAILIRNLKCRHTVAKATCHHSAHRLQVRTCCIRPASQQDSKAELPHGKAADSVGQSSDVSGAVRPRDAIADLLCRLPAHCLSRNWHLHQFFRRCCRWLSERFRLDSCFIRRCNGPLPGTAECRYTGVLVHCAIFLTVRSL